MSDISVTVAGTRKFSSGRIPSLLRGGRRDVVDIIETEFSESVKVDISIDTHIGRDTLTEVDREMDRGLFDVKDALEAPTAVKGALQMISMGLSISCWRSWCFSRDT